MKPQIYTVICPGCEEELFEGDKLQVENWLKNNWLEDNAEWDDYEVTVECPDCARLNS